MLRQIMSDFQIIYHFIFDLFLANVGLHARRTRRRVRGLVGAISVFLIPIRPP
jgi:hypothetical protein